MTRDRLTRDARGFSLIELLVAMAIGLILTLAITSVMVRSEGSKRSSTSVNDINQSGAYAAYVLDRTIRSAGSGFAQSWNVAIGCRIDAAASGVQVLPMAASVPTNSAFANFSLPVRLAPIVIAKDLANTSSEVRGDILLVMAGTAGVGESPQTVKAGSVDTSTTPPQLQLPSALGYVTNDVLLLVDPSVTGGCMMQQVGGSHAASDAGPVLPLGGTYHRTTGTNVNLSAFGTTTTLLQLGRDIANPPQFLLYGVGANNTLMSYDLLQPPPAAPAVADQSISDSIVEMRAVYGLDSTLNGSLDTWTDATSPYDAATLTNGSATSQLNLRKIVAVRIGLILRTSLPERLQAASTPTNVLGPETLVQGAGKTLTLFSDLPGLQKTRTLTTAELPYRFRTVEITIPLRNVLLAP